MFSSDLYLARASLLATSVLLRAAKVIEDRLEMIPGNSANEKIIPRFFGDDFCLRHKMILASSVQAIPQIRK
jgi:hypothetical protein